MAHLDPCTWEVRIFFRKRKNDVKILVVCTANITRSPYVAALLRTLLTKHGSHLRRRISVESAGVNANPNMPALPTMSTIAYTKGLDLQNHRSRILTPEMIREATLILTMEQAHKERILQRHPEMFEKVFLITEYGRGQDRSEVGDVIDPTGKDLEEFQEFVALAESESKRVMDYMLRMGVLE